MAKKPAADVAAGQVEARVLSDGAYGNVGDVVLVSEAEAAAGLEAGALDPHPDAVAYAKSLQSPKGD